MEEQKKIMQKERANIFHSSFEPERVLMEDDIDNPLRGFYDTEEEALDETSLEEMYR